MTAAHFARHRVIDVDTHVSEPEEIVSKGLHDSAALS